MEMDVKNLRWDIFGSRNPCGRFFFFLCFFLSHVFFDCYFTFPLCMNMPFYKPSERALAYPSGESQLQFGPEAFKTYFLRLNFKSTKILTVIEDIFY